MDKLKSGIGEVRMIPVSRPYFPAGSLKYAHAALDSSWVSSRGKYLEMVKEILWDYWDTPYIILTSSGTAAVHLVARALKAKYPHIYNIWCPNNVYVAAWNGFVFEDYNLIPVDAKLETWNANIFHIQPRDCDAILAVHNLGNPINVPELRKHFPNTPIVEDACEAFGGTYSGRIIGTASDAFAMSFFGNKNLTSGEGGAFVTYDPFMYEKALRYWGQGVDQDSTVRFVHAEIGHNYRMTNVEAAILYGQLKLRVEIAERKSLVFEKYREKLGHLVGDIFFQGWEHMTRHSNWMFGIRIPKQKGYEQAERFFNDNDIEVRPMFYPITRQNHLARFHGGTHKNAETLSRECVILPSSTNLSDEEQDFIVGKVEEYAKYLVR